MCAMALTPRLIRRSLVAGVLSLGLAVAATGAGAATLVKASSGPLSATLAPSTHTPKVNAKWPIVVTATLSGKPAHATAVYEFLYDGAVVGTGYVKNNKHFSFTGHFSDSLVFPPSSDGEPLTLSVAVTTIGHLALTFGVWVLGASVALSGPELALTSVAAPAPVAARPRPRLSRPATKPLRMSLGVSATTHMIPLPKRHLNSDPRRGGAARRLKLQRGGGFLGGFQAALHEVEPAFPEARIAQVDADDRAELLGTARAAA